MIYLVAIVLMILAKKWRYILKIIPLKDLYIKSIFLNRHI